MWRALPRGPACCLLAGFAALGCGRGSPEGIRSPSSSTTARSPAFVAPARFLPDLTSPPSSTTELQADGTRRFIVSGMRILDHPDGAIERARQILPTGVARVVSLPTRLGGGLVVYVVAGSGTQVWRAKSWLDDLEPLGEVWGAV